MACRYTYKGKTYEAHEFDDVLRAMSPAEAAAFMPSVQAVPAAPFVGKTDAWVALALKRIVKMAVDEGYDRVAFVTGEQSADRYDLSKQIERVIWLDKSTGGIGRPDMDGPPETGHLEAYDHNGRRVIDERMEPSKVEDYVGKEVAKRLFEAAPRASQRAGIGMRERALSGLDLKVGGEGMKAFYDKIVPTVLKDVLRKVGGGALGQVRIGVPDTMAPRGDDPEARHEDRDVRPGGLLVQPGFDITPAMREKAAGGLPLFGRGANESTGLTVTGVQAAVDELTKTWKNAPTIVVAQDMRDPLIPLAVRRHDEHQRSLGATGDVRGFFHGGKVYVIANDLPTHAAVAEVVFHEALGHYGLRGVFDQGLNDVLRQMATAMPERVLAKARQYGLVDRAGQYHTEDARLLAAEEVLAEIASERPSSTWVQRAIAAIKQWLRDNVPGLAGLKLTDADVIALFIEPARRFVERGAPARAARGVTVPAFSRSTQARRQGLPGGIAEIHTARDTDALKAHRDYAAAKAGDMDAAARLVRDLVRPADIEAARSIGEGLVWAYPHALEASGHNMIPAMMAARYAAETGGTVAEPLIQVNRAFHTGADAMQRLIARPLFDGPVEAGRRYVLVDDVSTMGGTLAELANHIQDGGGQVVGVVTLANAGRAPTMPALKQQLREIERRYGQALRDDFQIEPAALTRDEARYVLGFRDADALRNRAAAAKRDRGERLRAKGLQEDLNGDAPAFSRAPATDSEAFRRWFGDGGSPSSAGAVTPRQTASAERRVNGGASDAKAIADLLVGEPFRLQGFGGFDVPTQRRVLEGVRGVGQDLQVARRVVELLPIRVVNILGGEQRAAERLFGDSSMLKQLLSADRDGSVSTAVDVSDALVRAVAGVATERRNSAGGVAAGSRESGAAAGAGKRNHSVSAGHNQEYTGNRGTFDPANPDIRFSRGPQQPLAGVPAVPPPPAPPRQAPIPASGSPGPNSVWSMPEGTKLDNAIYKFQDKNVDLKRATAAIRDESRTIGDRFDAYLQEELYHGRAASRVEDFAENELRPLIAEMKLRAVTQERLSQYLHARHAEEANQLIADRGGLQDAGSGMATADARAFLAGLDPAEKRRLEAVAAKVDAMIAKTRQTIVDYGLEARDTVDGWAAMFKHYVPLQREEHDGEGMGIGQGFSIRGKEAKSRTGSTAAVSDILANVALQREKAIVRGEKNRVAVAMVGLALTNPNPDVWKVEQPPTEQVLNPTTQQIERRTVPGYKSLPTVLVAKIKDGKGNVAERVVVFNERNERAVRMATALKNLDAEKLEGLIAASAKVTRYFASINTQYNPVFGFTNLVRDLQAAAINLSGTPIDGRRAEVMAQAMKFLGEAARAGFRMDGIKDQKLWQELQAEGGTTGYRDLYRTTEDRASAIKRELDPHAWMREGYGRVLTAGASAPARGAQNVTMALFDWLSDFNESLENVTRLAAYKVALDHGMSRQRAASLAKNLTVNFNRGGAQKPLMGAMYAFFNAAMQGTARIAQTLFEMKGGDVKTLHLTKAGKAIIGGGITLGVLQALALAAAGFEDDDIPEFIKERNLILPLLGTNKKYVTIPMPLGYHVLPNMGRRAAELAIDGGKGAGKKAAEMFGTMLDAFNPLGGGGTVAQILSPTALDPMVALLENKDWTGQPIAKKDWNPVEPGFKNAREASSDVGKWIAQGINRASGGTEFVRGKVSPTPDQIDYLIGQATGGVGRELSKAATMASAARTGETLPTYKIPLLGRFYGDASQAHNQASRFYEALTRMREHKATIDGLAKEGRRDELQAYLKANPEAKMADVAERASKKLSELRAARRLLIENGQRQRVKELEQQITEYMTTFNKKVDEVQAPSSGATSDQTKAPARASQEPATTN